MSTLILASSSIYRKKLLERIINNFEIVPPEIDESDFKSHIHEPELLSTTLAEEKALAVLKKYPEATVIGSDQVVSLEGEILSKPGTIEKAQRQLESLQSKKHNLYTSFCIVNKLRKQMHTHHTVLHMKALTPQQIANYINKDKPFDCAGSYKFEEHGISLFEKVECNDQSAVTGLPLIKLSLLLEEFGFELLSSH